MKRLFMAMVLLVLSTMSLAADPAFITGMSIQPNSTFSRFIFTMTKKAVGHVSFSPNPDKVTIEFANAKNNFKIQNAKLPGSNVASLEAMETPKGAVKFILYTNGKVRWKTKYLPVKKNEKVMLQVDILSQ